MTVRHEIVFDRGPTAQTVCENRRGRRTFVATAALLAIVIVVAIQVVAAPTPEQGSQATSADSFVLESASFSGWGPLVSQSGELRAGYPVPMVWTAGRVCVGFARLEFGPDDVRPSLARCERQRVEKVEANEIRSLVSVKAGFDTWHFIEAGDHLDSIEIYLANGERVSDGRILLAGSIGALRLEIERDLATVEWSTASSTYRCRADPTAWRTSVFCVE